MICIEMAIHQSIEKSRQKNSALSVPFQSGSPRGNTASFAEMVVPGCVINWMKRAGKTLQEFTFWNWNPFYF